MSDEHSSCYCAAHGCNQLGTMTGSTSGDTKWWCFMHFGKEGFDLATITLEINRREWLSKLITSLRTSYWTDRWADTFKVARHEIAMHQRGDLQFGDDDKSAWTWIRRLEGELHAMVRGVPTAEPKQGSLT